MSTNTSGQVSLAHTRNRSASGPDSSSISSRASTDSACLAVTGAAQAAVAPSAASRGISGASAAARLMTPIFPGSGRLPRNELEQEAAHVARASGLSRLSVRVA